MWRALFAFARHRIKSERKVGLGQLHSKGFAEDVAIFCRTLQHAPLGLATGVPHREPRVEQRQARPG
jgi:hypothetical protein